LERSRAEKELWREKKEELEKKERSERRKLNREKNKIPEYVKNSYKPKPEEYEVP
jgi:hypothetical protein